MLSRRFIKNFKEEKVIVNYDKDSGKEHGTILVTGSKAAILTALATIMHSLLKSNEFTIIDLKELIHIVEVTENESK